MTCTHALASSGSGACFLCPPKTFLPDEEATAATRGAQRALRRRLESQLHKAHVEQCKRKLSAFLKHGWHVLEPGTPLEWAEHIDVLCDHIQAMLEGWIKARNQIGIDHEFEEKYRQECQNLAVNVPPGTLKSRILSVYAPAWMWVEHPEWRLLALSSNPAVADRDADYSKQVIESTWYQTWFQPTWTMRPERNAIRHFENTRGGYRITRGLNATVTGLRGDAIFIDDPNDVKDVSDVKLKAVNNNWKAAQNRVNDPRIALRVLIQQRTHELDLTGFLYSTPEDGTKMVKDWQHLSIPMEREKDPKTGLDLECTACNEIHGASFLGWIDERLEGEVLQPERNTPEVLAKERRALGPYGYAGQMQQRPAPLGGGMFKKTWWRTYDSLEMIKGGKRPKLDKCVISVDATFKLEGTSRMCVGVVGGIGPKRPILDVWVGRADILGAQEEIEKMIKKFPYYTKILIEDKANGSALITMLSKKYGNVIACNPEGGKVSRANAIVPAVAAGDVMLPRLAAWREEFIAEHGSFPNGRYDDQVDMLTQALNDMSEASAVEQARAMGSW